MIEATKIKFLRLLVRYKPREIPEIIEQVFPGVTWEAVRQTCVTFNLNLLKIKDLSTAIVHIFSESKPSKDVVEDSLWHLEFFDAVLHNRMDWNGALLTNQENAFPKDLEEIYKRIEQVYRMEARRAEVIIKMENDMIFIMTIEKIITKRGVKNGTPFFAVINVGIEKQYVFYRPKSAETYLQLFSQALGYSSFKTLNFSGCDVRSLFYMIKNHIDNKCLEVAVFRPNPFRVEPHVMDFTQGRERFNYSTHILPPGLTNLKNFTVNCKSDFFVGFPVDEGVCTSQITIRVKSNKSSIEDVFRKMMTSNLMPIPPPDFVTNFHSLNSNCFRMKYGGEGGCQTADMDQISSDSDYYEDEEMN